MKIELESGQKQGTRASHTPNACFSSVAREPGTGLPSVLFQQQCVCSAELSLLKEARASLGSTGAWQNLVKKTMDTKQKNG